ncbi:flagellin [Agrobacterium rosae]|uniref:flagellin N-terminal helical domain-containing protein n=1 Tax=Agrobacterium rosae TaxID=1972867 RepID=UPI002A0CFEC4|nr:flagellin [Agrobacterium rosae]MDX8317086.1 flagellin [Agrobacterium rosae]
MTSILTNNTAAAALQTLRAVNGALDKTRAETSSGLRVEAASDGVAYWSIATTMRSDSKALSAVHDALGLTAAKVDVAYAGMDNAVDLVSEFNAKLVLAKEPSADREKIDGELTQLKKQLRSVAYGASFNGENWLAMTDDNWREFAVERTAPGYIARDGDSFSIGTVKLHDALDGTVSGTAPMYALLDDTGGASTGQMGILTNVVYSQDLATSTKWVILHSAGNPDPALGAEISLTKETSSEDIDDMITVTEAMLQDVVKWTSHLGATQKRISMQEDLVVNLSVSIDSGVSRLVDADMEEVSTRLQALQTQQQLAVQSLQIANSEPQRILALFQ